MLVYDGNQPLGGASSLQSKINATQGTWEPPVMPATASSKRLIWNRACALALLLGVNGLTYVAIRTMVSN